MSGCREPGCSFVTTASAVSAGRGAFTTSTRRSSFRHRRHDAGRDRRPRSLLRRRPRRAVLVDRGTEYANGATVIHMDLVTAKKRAKQFELGGMASLVTGSKGWIWVSRQGVRTEPESLAQAVIGPNEKRVMISDDHKRNFLDAIRKRAQPISPITAAVHAETMCQQSDIAMSCNASCAGILRPNASSTTSRRTACSHAQFERPGATRYENLRICSHNRCWVILTAAGPHECAPAAQSPAPAAQPQAPTAAGQAQEPRRRREVSPEERAKIEVALPAKAPATPRKSRKLLVFDRQGIYNGRPYGGHASIRTPISRCS